MTLAVQLRTFLSKGFKVRLNFPLLLTVKCERRETEGENVKQKEPESEKIWKISLLQKYEEEHSRDNIKGTAK